MDERKCRHIPLLFSHLHFFKIIAVPAHTAKTLRPELIGSSQAETNQNVKRARQHGQAVQIEVERPEQPRLAFVLDTQIEALTEPGQSQKNLSCPVIMIECTYLEETMVEEARKRGHICWFELLPFVGRSLEIQQSTPQTWILVHFSLRYVDEQIEAFFRDPEKSRICLDDDESVCTRHPANLVLWFDGGPVELWIKGVL